MKHLNIDTCEKCEDLIKGSKSEKLIDFYKSFRAQHKDAHISCVYRGKVEQEEAKRTGHSKAGFGESPHNFGLALDWFRITLSGGAAYDKPWYELNLGPKATEAGLVWGGSWNSFKDYPHVETADWKLNKLP